MTWTNGIDNSGGNPATLWDGVFFDGLIQPGVWTCTIDGDNGVDVQKANKKRGARIRDSGQAPLKMTLTCQLQPRELVDFRRRTLPFIRPRAGSAGQPVVEILHPNAQLFGIKFIKCMTFSSPMPTKGGTLTITMKCVHVVPEKQVKQGKRKEVVPGGGEELQDAILTEDANQTPGSGPE